MSRHRAVIVVRAVSPGKLIAGELDEGATATVTKQANNQTQRVYSNFMTSCMRHGHALEKTQTN